MPVDTSFSWHAELGIDDSPAAELYKANPNDPQIKQWQDAMMNQINNNKGVCFEKGILGLHPDTQRRAVESCLYLIENVILPNVFI